MVAGEAFFTVLCAETFNTGPLFIAEERRWTADPFFAAVKGDTGAALLIAALARRTVAHLITAWDTAPFEAAETALTCGGASTLWRWPKVTRTLPICAAQLTAPVETAETFWAWATLIAFILKPSAIYTDIINTELRARAEPLHTGWSCHTERLYTGLTCGAIKVGLTARLSAPTCAREQHQQGEDRSLEQSWFYRHLRLLN